MNTRVEPHHDFSPAETGWVEERLYEYNLKATGRSDGEGLAFVIRDAEEVSPASSVS